MIIDIFEWDITYTELVHWVANTGAELRAVTGLGGSFSGRFVPSTKYEFANEDDYVAFSLAFQKEKKLSV